MKLSLSTWSLHRLFFERRIRLTSMPALAKTLGFDGIELEDIWFPQTGDRFLQALKHEARNAGVAVSVAISNDFTVSPGKLAAQIAHVRKFFRIASMFDNDVVRVLMGRASSTRRSIDQVKSSLRALLPQAHDLGLKIAIENHDRLSRDPEVMLEVLDQVDPLRLGVCLDFGNLNSKTREASLRRLAPRALLVHAKAYGFGSDGEERSINYRTSFSILRKSGFRGPVVIEYDGKGDQLLGSLRTLALIRKYAK